MTTVDPVGEPTLFLGPNGPEKVRVASVTEQSRLMLEATRGRLAQALVLLLALVVVGVLLAVTFGKAAVADLKDTGALILTPLFTIVGSVTGFYFGAKQELE